MFGWIEYGDHGKWKKKNGEKNMTFHYLVGEGEKRKENRVNEISFWVHKFSYYSKLERK